MFIIHRVVVIAINIIYSDSFISHDKKKKQPHSFHLRPFNGVFWRCFGVIQFLSNRRWMIFDAFHQNIDYFFISLFEAAFNISHTDTLQQTKTRFNTKSFPFYDFEFIFLSVIFNWSFYEVIFHLLSLFFMLFVSHCCFLCEFWQQLCFVSSTCSNQWIDLLLVFLASAVELQSTYSWRPWPFIAGELQNATEH